MVDTEKPVVVHGGHRQADAVDGDGAFLHHIAQISPAPHGRCTRRRYRPVGCWQCVPTPSTWPATICPPKRPLAAMARSRLTMLPAVSPCKGRAVQRLVHHVRRKAIRKKLRDRQADAVHGDAVSDPGSLQDGFRLDRQHGGVLPALDLLDRSDFFYDSCEHGYSTSLSIRKSSPSRSKRLFFNRKAASGGEDARALHGGLRIPSAEQLRGDICLHLLHDSAFQRGPVQRSAALQQNTVDLLLSPAVPSAAGGLHDRFSPSGRSPGIRRARYTACLSGSVQQVARIVGIWSAVIDHLRLRRGPEIGVADDTDRIPAVFHAAGQDADRPPERCPLPP